MNKVHSKMVFVFDIDGTIIEKNEPISSMANEIFNKVISSGNILFFATARSIRGVKKVLPKWCFDYNIIYCNGAFSTLNRNLIFSDPIKSNNIEHILNLLIRYNIVYYIEFGDCYYHEKRFQNSFFNILKDEAPNELLKSKLDFANKPIYKIVLLSNMTDEFIRELKELNMAVKLYFHSDGSIDIVSNTCSKWNALSNILNDDYNIISFGNDINDYELLKNSFFSVAVQPKNNELIPVANKIITKFNLNDIRDIVDNFIFDNSLK